MSYVGAADAGASYRTFRMQGSGGCSNHWRSVESRIGDPLTAIGGW